MLPFTISEGRRAKYGALMPGDDATILTISLGFNARTPCGFGASTGLSQVSIAVGTLLNIGRCSAGPVAALDSVGCVWERCLHGDGLTSIAESEAFSSDAILSKNWVRSAADLGSGRLRLTRCRRDGGCSGDVPRSITLQTLSSIRE